MCVVFNIYVHEQVNLANSNILFQFAVSIFYYFSKEILTNTFSIFYFLYATFNYVAPSYRVSTKLLYKVSQKIAVYTPIYLCYLCSFELKIFGLYYPFFEQLFFRTAFRFLSTKIAHNVLQLPVVAEKRAAYAPLR